MNGFYVPGSASGSYVANKRDEEGTLLYEGAANEIGIQKQAAIQQLEKNYAATVENAYASYLAANRGVQGSQMGQGYKELYKQIQQQQLQQNIASTTSEFNKQVMNVEAQEESAKQQLQERFQQEVSYFDRLRQSLGNYFEYVKTLTDAGQKNITLAIEAGSERLRKVINKNLNENKIMESVKISAEAGLRGLKFYGMIGLPTETEDDIQALIKLAEKIKKSCKGFDISFGFSSFVPKPNTPFQWIGRENTKLLEAKAAYLKKEMHKLGVHTNFSSIKWDYWQAVLSRGGEGFSDFLIDTYRAGGKLGDFKKAARNNNIDTDFYALENLPFESDLPWNFIDVKPGRDFLIKENKRLLSL